MIKLATLRNSNALWQLTVGVTVAIACADAAHALPPNPERPNMSMTCKQAIERTREAAHGSPLIDAATQRKVLLDTIAVAERLCVDQRRKHTRAR